jgi:hypothetical protein
MDMDKDLDQTLLWQFNSLGITDGFELVRQLQILVGNNSDEPTAAFFLDTNNSYVN